MITNLHADLSGNHHPYNSWTQQSYTESHHIKNLHTCRHATRISIHVAYDDNEHSVLLMNPWNRLGSLTCNMYADLQNWQSHSSWTHEKWHHLKALTRSLLTSNMYGDPMSAHKHMRSESGQWSSKVSALNSHWLSRGFSHDLLLPDPVLNGDTNKGYTCTQIAQTTEPPWPPIASQVRPR